MVFPYGPFVIIFIITPPPPKKNILMIQAPTTQTVCSLAADVPPGEQAAAKTDVTPEHPSTATPPPLGFRV